MITADRRLYKAGIGRHPPSGCSVSLLALLAPPPPATRHPGMF
jgi:hypothetical protein